MDINDVFATSGLIAKAKPDYKYRAGQAEMASRIYGALQDYSHFIAEGPTGTGKSFAYLTAAVLAALERDKRTRVVVVTANINLQEQLIQKDLPFLKKVLPFDLPFAMAKGVGNYLCVLEHKETKEKGKLIKLRKKYDQSVLDSLEDWAMTTLTGDRSELIHDPDPHLWSHYSASGGDCLGRDCPEYRSCFAYRSRHVWEKADVLVANYHLFFADVASEFNVLPAHAIVIFDEAHRAAGIAREFFGAKVSIFTVRKALRRLRDNIFKDGLFVMADRFFKELLEYRRSDAYSSYLRQPDPLLLAAWEPLREKLSVAINRYQTLSTGTQGVEHDRIMQSVESLRKVISVTSSALKLTDTRFVYCIDEEKGRAVLFSKMIDVGYHLNETIYNDSFKQVIFTSATLSAGGSFSYMRKELGIPDYVGDYSAPTPFDLAKQAVFIVGGDLPPPVGDTRPRHLEASTEAMIQAVLANRGRALLLFTSRLALEFAHNAMRARGMPFEIIVQGQYSKPETLRRFSTNTSSVLLGLSSFWEGVDVPGESLSLLVIDKLPFPRPDDAVISKLSDHDVDWFQNQSLPRAVIAFRQGMGRLIRSVSDYGLLLFTDPRLVTKDYGGVFLNELRGVPHIPRSANLLDVVAHLDNKRAQVSP